MHEELIIENSPRTIIDRGKSESEDSSFVLDAGARLTYCFAFLGQSVRRKLRVTMNAGAELRIVGFFLGRFDDDIRLDISVTHAGPGTTGLTNLRGVLTDRAQANFKGLIIIPPAGYGTKAFLEERVYVFGRAAKTESLPSLEIEANDVKAGHAATSSGLDEAALFYAMSRGLPRLEASRMLVEGHLLASIAGLPASVCASLQPAVARAVRTLTLPYA